MWPFGTSRKDRKRIDHLESEVQVLNAALEKLLGMKPERYSGPFIHPCYIRGNPTIADLVKSIAELREKQDQTIDALGLSWHFQQSKTWLAKKKGGKRETKRITKEKP